MKRATGGFGERFRLTSSKTRLEVPDFRSFFPIARVSGRELFLSLRFSLFVRRPSSLNLSLVSSALDNST